ncbi:Orotate phosphoribosyltransferase [Hypsizygus marmoreus]|uniref:orotate phosphoribosyltransferase n=1 Tax=Hypsizygus marmoreus TaxID=39966 RepID=A0A369JQ08_HYPMA|nr:Orotate phosphoribosyltransferase [Hypsizygus marmoreus]
MSSTPLQPHQIDLIEKAMSVDALKFGSFTLKSGRISPYFFNAGLLSTGPILATLSNAYAATIVSAFSSPKNPLPKFDVLFGPAYKGIPFASTTSLVLHTQYQVDVGFAYDRKEAKDHGEGGKMVGVPVQGKKVVILDDVMTSGKAVRGAIDTVRQAGGEVVGVIQALDREEVGQDGSSSTVQEIEGLIGEGRVKSILKMRDLLVWLEKNGMTKELESMREYWNHYGLKSQESHTLQ